MYRIDGEDVVTDAGQPQPPDSPPAPGWWKASDGAWYPPESAPATNAPMPAPAPVVAPPPQSPYLVTIGDIGVTADQVVTPNGSAPLRGSQWIATDMTRTESKIPSWAIILAIVFAIFCLIGLLFLLVKEQQTTGYVDVSVRSDNLYHQTQVPISSPEAVAHVRQQVAYVQSLAARAG